MSCLNDGHLQIDRFWCKLIAGYGLDNHQVLYTFSKAGDSVAIGRDKRQCAIKLGSNAQGVSRVHLKLQLQPNGSVRFLPFFLNGYIGVVFAVVRSFALDRRFTETVIF
ncbi:unnamed protein product [Gongylonema pulchrum]|uniref:FHA domain-containing protein n=1 Tax=Gongylonema pulchrum TaxID=637853 RepID=A0A183EXW4_9BILA|nr:unnamed protein product [Gongylonema pulchrum]